MLDGLLGAGIGLIGGGIPSYFEKKGEADRQRQLQADKERYSWITGQHGDAVGNPGLTGELLKGAGTGFAIGTNLEKVGKDANPVDTSTPAPVQQVTPPWLQMEPSPGPAPEPMAPESPGYGDPTTLKTNGSDNMPTFFARNRRNRPFSPWE